MYFLHKYYHIGVRVSFSQRGELTMVFFERIHIWSFKRWYM